MFSLLSYNFQLLLPVYPMSLSQLEKYIRENQILQPPTIQKRTVIVVSDSKGKYLKRCVESIVPEKNIIWEFKGGRTTKQAVDHIATNIDYYRHKYGSLLLLLWTGTCDLTSKVDNSCKRDRKIIVDIRQTSVDEIVLQYERFLSVCSSYGDNVKPIILECPYYSISIWNNTQGHPNPTSFDKNNLILHQQITELNQRIKTLNEIHNVTAPRFSTDMIRCRKLKKNYPTKTVSYSLLKDGIHPGVTLSKYWIRRLVIAVIFKYCY